MKSLLSLTLLLTITEISFAHDNARDKMMISDAGIYRALLNAHLSTSGNKLEVHFETATDNPTPKAPGMVGFTATAQVVTDGGKEHVLSFFCAPTEEKESCSHFVASAPWMQKNDMMAITAKFGLSKDKIHLQWQHFVPQQYAQPRE